MNKSRQVLIYLCVLAGLFPRPLSATEQANKNISDCARMMRETSAPITSAALLDSKNYPPNRPVTIYYSASLSGKPPTEAKTALPDLAKRLPAFKLAEGGAKSAYFIEEHSDGNLKFILRGLPRHHSEVLQSPELSEAHLIAAFSPEIQTKIIDLELFWKLVSEKNKKDSRLTVYLNLMPADQNTGRTDDALFIHTYPELNRLKISARAKIELEDWKYYANRNMVEVIAPAKTILEFIEDSQILNVMTW